MGWSHGRLHAHEFDHFSLELLIFTAIGGPGFALYKPNPSRIKHRQNKRCTGQAIPWCGPSDLTLRSEVTTVWTEAVRHSSPLIFAVNASRLCCNDGRGLVFQLCLNPKEAFCNVIFQSKIVMEREVYEAKPLISRLAAKYSD